MPETIIRPGAPASGRVTPASFPFYTTGEDNLRVTSYNSKVGVTLKVNARTLDSRGIPTPDSWDHTPNTDRSSKTTDISLSGATLLNLTVFANAGAPLIGQTFVIVQLIRGMGAAAIVLGTILQGYVTGVQAVGWPGSPIQSSIEGGGVMRWLVGTDPPAGIGIAETVPTGARWELLALSLVLVTGAAVANRRVELSLTSSGVTAFNTLMPATQPASISQNYTFSQGVALDSAPGADLTVAALCLALPLPSGSVINVGASGFQAADNFTSPLIAVREWLEAQ